MIGKKVDDIFVEEIGIDDLETGKHFMHYDCVKKTWRNRIFIKITNRLWSGKRCLHCAWVDHEGDAYSKQIIPKPKGRFFQSRVASFPRKKKK